jgi:5'-nucleotidase
MSMANTRLSSRSQSKREETGRASVSIPCWLRTMGNLTIVVPEEEQSWTGQSISRFRYLYLDTVMLRDGQAYCVDGTPADCINLGIYHVLQQKPDLVGSGINIGINAGLGFALSSGTIGACLEANIAGIPAIA